MKTIAVTAITTLLFCFIFAPNLQAQTNWRTDGNAGTTDNHFLGTTDNRPFRLRTNNTERMLLTSGGNFAIGTTSTTQKKFSIVDAGNATTAYFLNTANAVNGFTTVSLWSEINNNGAGQKRAAYFYAQGQNGTNFGLYARAENALHNYGVYANADGTSGGNVYGLLSRVTTPQNGTGYGLKVEMIGDNGEQFAAHLDGRVYVGGKLGIGTLNPKAALEFATDYGQKITFLNTGIGPNYGIGLQNNLLQIHSHGNNSDIAFGYGSSSNFTERMRIEGSGNVGIGTASPSAKLHVNGTGIVSSSLRVGTTESVNGYDLIVGGKAIAEELTIQLQDDWPDYVFESNYPLRPLQEVERYIQENKRLPDFPAATQVSAEGLDVGEINRKLTEKVEELTLYIIALEKRLAALEQQKNK